MLVSITGGMTLFILFYLCYKLYLYMSKSLSSTTYTFPASILVLFLTLLTYIFLWGFIFDLIEFNSDYYELYIITSSAINIGIGCLFSFIFIAIFHNQFDISLLYISNILILYFVIQPTYKPFCYLVYNVMKFMTSAI